MIFEKRISRKNEIEVDAGEKLVFDILTMKQISKDEAEQAQELFQNMMENFQELSRLVKSKLDRAEIELFRYRCLAHCEPGLYVEHSWVTGMGVTSLEEYVQKMQDFCENGDDENEDEEEI